MYMHHIVKKTRLKNVLGQTITSSLGVQSYCTTSNNRGSLKMQITFRMNLSVSSTIRDTLTNKNGMIKSHIKGNIFAAMNIIVVRGILEKGIIGARITTRTRLATNMQSFEIVQSIVLQSKLVVCLHQGNNPKKKRASVLYTVRGVKDGVKKPLTKMVEASHCLSSHLVQTTITSKSSFVPRKAIDFRLTNQVKWFHVCKGYGFIHTEDLKSNVFIHYSAIIKNNPWKFMKSVAKWEIVEFDVVMGSKNLPEAANVTGPNNIPVRGSRYTADRRLVYNKNFKLQQPPVRNSYINYSCNKLSNQQQRNRKSNNYRKYYNSDSSQQLTRKDLRS